MKGEEKETQTETVNTTAAIKNVTGVKLHIELKSA